MRRITITFLFFFFICLSGAFANKTSVEVKAPADVKKGDEITIVINVSHNGNSKTHHTDWVYLKINGKEVQRWSYTKTSLPVDGQFTVEFKVVANEALYIEAQGDCNIHGSAGLKNAEVKVTE
jgi:desulfoferrodoxin (superoxide reductase-like protein)